MAENKSKASVQPLVIFAHSDGFDRLYQTASIALTAAVSGRPVAVVLFFWALRAVVKGKMDEFVFAAASEEAAQEAGKKITTGNNPPPSEMLRMARETGRVRLYACSASIQYMGLGLEETAKAVDEVVGLSTILRLSLDGPETIYI